MSNLEKYTQVFVEVFQAKEEEVKSFKYQESAGWDSVGHMSLVATLEDIFDIMLDTDDIIDFSSYEKGVELLKRYGVEF